ncbi:E3 ubiquitin-protein ligase MARCH2 [Nymphon striatum]|nr:E3 ubiquitin-protein ligase MARCH2 [Nymphon striatum]
MNYCIEHQKSDVLVTGIAQHENPYKENKSYCSSGSGEKLHLVHYREPITKWNKQSCKCREHYNYLKFRKKEIFTYHWNLYMKKKMENSINTDFCRICQIYVSEEKLVSPCHCKGSVASVHLSCLEKWLNLSNIDTCELCQYKFQIKHVKKSFIDWLKTPTTLAEKKHLLFDVVTLLALSMFTLISARICMAGASYYLERSTTNKHVILEACGLILLTVLLCIVYICWVVIALSRNVEIQPIITGNVSLNQVDRYTYLGQLTSIHKDWDPEIRPDLTQIVKSSKWNWAGHLIRRTDDNWTTKSTIWITDRGGRKRGKSKRRWVDDIAKFDRDWVERAADREDWRSRREAFAQQWASMG